MNTMLAVISGETVIWVIVQLVIGALIYFVLNWALAKLSLPEPFQKISTVLLVLLVVLFVCNALLTLAGHPLIVWR